MYNKKVKWYIKPHFDGISNICSKNYWDRRTIVGRLLRVDRITLEGI